jgi:hypothetical protein
MSRQQGLVSFSDVESSVIEKLYIFTVSENPDVIIVSAT